MRKKFLLAIGLAMALGFSSCSKDEEPSDYAIRDEKIIQDYFIANDITDAIADLSGVYISHITKGSGDNIDVNTIVRVKYSIYSLPNNTLLEEVTELTTWSLVNSIAGLKIGMPYMQKGGVADLYMPCRYAFLGTNSSFDTTVLRFRITLEQYTATIEEMDDIIIQEYFTDHEITDVIKDPTGVYIQHLVEGTGDSPTLNDNITVKYELYSLPSDVRTPQTEDPITFKLSSLIAGWQIGIPYMKEGGEAYLYVPRNLAYGEKVLKFKITLLGGED